MTPKTERDLVLAISAFLIILGVVSAMGSVSLGSYTLPAQQGGATSSYLVTNYAFVLLALVLSSLGAFFCYQAGRAYALAQKNSEKKREEEYNIRN
ncbi:MAG: hypothetical protein PXY39_12665 [archaeon]|nr:hypothetical protein [archaeon]